MRSFLGWNGIGVNEFYRIEILSMVVFVEGELFLMDIGECVY